MDASELQDFKENLEQGAQEEQLRPVAFTMSVLAVLLAVTTVMGERTHADAIINQNKATDQWNEYQAQKIRDYDTQLATDLLSVVALDNKDATAKMTKAYTDHEKKWAEEAEAGSGNCRGAAGQRGPGRSALGPLRSGRSVTGDRAGNHVGHAADAEPHLLVPGDGILSHRRGRGRVGLFSQVAADCVEILVTRGGPGGRTWRANAVRATLRLSGAPCIRAPHASVLQGPVTKRWPRAQHMCPRRHLRILPARTRPSLFGGEQKDRRRSSPAMDPRRVCRNERSHGLGSAAGLHPGFIHSSVLRRAATTESAEENVR